ncbi:MAG: TetR/AcrR family transcriptional regulator [Lapillicoccus sp.]
MNKGRGRPPAGGPDARAAICAAASDLFLERGYTAATVREIARRAGYDVALVSYYFGSKGELFAEVMLLTLGPSQVLKEALVGDPSTLAPRLVARVIIAWEDPHAGPQLGRLAREAIANADLLPALRGYLDRELMVPLVEYFGGHHATEQAAATIAVVIGMIFSRYVIALDHVTKVSPALYVQTMVPVLAQAATGRRPNRPASKRP